MSHVEHWVALLEMARRAAERRLAPRVGTKRAAQEAPDLVQEAATMLLSRRRDTELRDAEHYFLGILRNMVALDGRNALRRARQLETMARASMRMGEQRPCLEDAESLLRLALDAIGGLEESDRILASQSIESHRLAGTVRLSRATGIPRRRVAQALETSRKRIIEEMKKRDDHLWFMAGWEEEMGGGRP